MDKVHLSGDANHLSLYLPICKCHVKLIERLTDFIFTLPDSPELLSLSKTKIAKIPYFVNGVKQPPFSDFRVSVTPPGSDLPAYIHGSPPNNLRYYNPSDANSYLLRPVKGGYRYDNNKLLKTRAFNQLPYVKSEEDLQHLQQGGDVGRLPKNRKTRSHKKPLKNVLGSHNL